SGERNRTLGRLEILRVPVAVTGVEALVMPSNERGAQIVVTERAVVEHIRIDRIWDRGKRLRDPIFIPATRQRPIGQVIALRVGEDNHVRNIGGPREVARYRRRQEASARDPDDIGKIELVRRRWALRQVGVLDVRKGYVVHSENG